MDLSKILEADPKLEKLLARINRTEGDERDDLIDEIAAAVLAYGDEVTTAEILDLRDEGGAR